MKFVWELQDIKVGRRVWSANRNEEYIIGYDPSISNDNRYNLVSLLDGMVAIKDKSAFEMGGQLNSSSMIPDSIIKE